MSKQGKWIIALLALGLVLFSSVHFVIIPKQNAAAEQYIVDQQRPLTHDLDYILKYKHPYMGNAGNIINLFYHLPLNDINRDYEIKSDQLTLIVNYHGQVSEIGLYTVQQSLIYNSTAAFALIGNLEKIEYRFQDDIFEVDRENIEKLYQTFDSITSTKELWNEVVRNPLKDRPYVEDSWQVMTNN